MKTADYEALKEKHRAWPHVSSFFFPDIDTIKQIEADARKELEQERDTLKRSNAELEQKVLRCGEALVTATQTSLELAASEAKLRTVLVRSGKCECEWSCHNERGEIMWGGQRLVSKCHNCKLVEEALSTTPATAFTEHMKPWVEFVERVNEVFPSDQARQLLSSIKP